MSRFWDNHARTIDLEKFRAHDQYLAQEDHYPYEAIFDHLRFDVHDTRMLAMGEDGAFGCRVWRVDDRPVSRDLLDSMLEIRFLEQHLPRFGISTFLDIGAGYGRLVHRLGQVHPDLQTFTVDPVPESEAVCTGYRAHRGGKWTILPFDPPRMPNAIAVGCAANVHSWSECTPEEFDYWVQMLARGATPWLFVVPHGADFSCRDAYTASVKDRSGARECEFRRVIDAWDYRLHAHEERFSRHYYLFRLDI